MMRGVIRASGMFCSLKIRTAVLGEMVADFTGGVFSAAVSPSADLTTERGSVKPTLLIKFFKH